MTQIIPIRPQNISFALDRPVHVGRLDCEFDECGVAGHAEKIITPDQKKGG